jgi:hypothetical protein
VLNSTYTDVDRLSIRHRHKPTRTVVQSYGEVPPELVTVAEALQKLDVKRDTFYNTLKRSGRKFRRWRKAGQREIFYDMRQLRPLFEKPQEIKG